MTPSRRTLLAVMAGFSLPAGAVSAEAQQSPPRRRPRRRPAARKQLEPLPEPPPPQPPPPPFAEPAPVPNRNIEPPRTATAEGPSLSPSILKPRSTPRGATLDRDQQHEELDRLFEPAPGARLRVPFAY